MASETVHAVRQVIMNDLGLSRESVRSEMEKVVKETIERRLNDEWFIQVERRAIEYMVSMMKTYRKDFHTVVFDAVKDAAMTMALEYVKEHFKITRCGEDDEDEEAEYGR